MAANGFHVSSLTPIGIEAYSCSVISREDCLRLDFSSFWDLVSIFLSLLVASLSFLFHLS